MFESMCIILEDGKARVSDGEGSYAKLVTPLRFDDDPLRFVDEPFGTGSAYEKSRPLGMRRMAIDTRYTNALLEKMILSSNSSIFAKQLTAKR